MATLAQRPPETESIISLTKVAGILALIGGVIALIVGAITLIVFIGVVFIVIGVLNVLIYTNCREIVELVERGEYRRAKEKTFAWMILGFIFGWVVVGILLLVAYIKYDELIRHTQPPQPLGHFT